MDRLNLHFLFEMGQRIGRLSVVRRDVKLHTIAVPLEAAADGLRILLTSAHPPIVKARPAAERLLGFVIGMLEDTERHPNRKISQRCIDIGDRMWSAFSVSLQMELPYLHVYCVSQTLAWDTDILVGNAEAMLPVEILPKIPPETLADWKQAGRCIAFDLHTASGFHTVRATESVIRDYYRHIVGSLPKIKDRNWGAYTRGLRKHGGADESILTFIDSIREHHRNPLMHPEHRLTKQEAAVLLSVCVGLIIQIAKALP